MNMDELKNKKTYKSVEEVPVWIKSHSLTLEVYRITSVFPKSEQYGLTSQLRRSSSSIPANITEGFYRNSTRELIQFLYNARGSLGESIYHTRLAKDLKLIEEHTYDGLREGFDEIGKQLNGWIKSLKTKLSK